MFKELKSDTSYRLSTLNGEVQTFEVVGIVATDEKTGATIRFENSEEEIFKPKLWFNILGSGITEIKEQEATSGNPTSRSDHRSNV